MDFFNLLFMCIFSFVVGVAVTIFLQYYVLMKYIRCIPIEAIPKKPANEKYCLPQEILKSFSDLSLSSQSTPVAINLILQFLFHELRHSNGVRKWFHRKLSLELDDLITKTTTGRLFDKLSIRDLHLGSQFPEIKNVTVEHVELDKSQGHIDTLDIGLELTYSGNFQLSIDANLVLGKRAYLAVKVLHVSGMARLQFTRHPYTHWSLSFVSEPRIDLAVESQFQGRQMQGNVTGIISNQIRKAIHRKHTLPNYKLRYKPFFARTDPGQQEIEDPTIPIEGKLEITAVEITRLATNTEHNIHKVYFTVAMDAIPWISLNQNGDCVVITIDATVYKTKLQQLGVVFKQESVSEKMAIVVIETIVPNSPASQASLMKGDVIQSIEGKKIVNMNQVAKIIKNINRGSFTIRIERKLNSSIYSVKNGAEESMETAQTFEQLFDRDTAPMKNEDLLKENIILETELRKTMKSNTKSIENLTKISFSKQSDSVQIPFTGFGLRKRRCSVEKTSSDSSAGSTPTASNTATPLRKCEQMKFGQSEMSLNEPELSPVDDTGMHTNQNVNNKAMAMQCFYSSELSLSNVLTVGDVFTFELAEDLPYLNVNVWGKCFDNRSDCLLGYLNIPITSVLTECKDSKLGHYLKSYSLLPPDFLGSNNKPHVLASHSGFEPCFCYGDILLSFMWYSIQDENPASAPCVATKRAIFKTSETSSTTPLFEVVDQCKKHDFIRTHFHRATQCDFCRKKIWLKDAVQCRDCALCCHKKCVTKCQANSICGATSANLLNKSAESMGNFTHVANPAPEFKMTEHYDEDFQQHGGSNMAENMGEDFDMLNEKKYNYDSHRQSFSDLISSVANQGLERANSFNNLSIPGLNSSSVTAGSKSLPPSPQHTPNRKHSLVVVDNPFDHCPAALEACDPTDPDSVATLVEGLCGSGEDIMAAAKDAGRTLYVSLPPGERLEKIHLMLSKLKQVLDNETTTHSELTKQSLKTDSPSGKTRAAFLLGQSDARIQALSVLMLHYCSGLQHAQEQTSQE